MTTITMILQGKPVPAVRMTQRSKWTPRAQRYLKSKGALALQMQTAMRGRARFGKTPLQVSIVFHYAKGADHRRDLDNEIKAVLDAANGILYTDDRWVDEIYAIRTLSDDGEDHVHLRVKELDAGAGHRWGMIE